MTDKPLVSIVLPTYNGEQYLSNAIDSVINQTYKNWELIIVNDCSTDSTLNIIQDYIKIDSRIKVITNKTNKKLPASLNIGFAEATGKYYTWTSDDNEYYPEAIEKMVNFLERNLDFGMVYAVCKTINVNNNVASIWGDIAITPIELLDFCVIGACFLYRQHIAKSVGVYDENYFLAEDHDYWLRLYLITKVGHIAEELYIYRLHNNSLTGKRANEARYLGHKLAIKYYKDYAEVFPAYSKQILNKWQLMDTLINEDDLVYKKIKHAYKNKYLYQQMKRLLKLNYSKWIMSKLIQLGGIYILKSIKFFKRP